MDPMTAIAGLSAAGGALSSLFGSDKAAKQQKKAFKFMRQQSAVARGDVSPYLKLGTSAMPHLLNALGLGDSNAALSRFRSSPEYQLQYGDMMDRAQSGALAAGALRGSLNSGSTLKALQDRASQVANKYWGNYTNGLDSLVGRGQNAATTSANIATGTGSQGSSILSGIGDTQAAGWLGAGNALQGGLGALAYYYGNKQPSGSLYGGSGYMGGPGNAGFGN